MQDMAVNGPVVEVAPALGIVRGKGIVERGGSWLGVGRETATGTQPLLVQGVEPLECAPQDAELVHPAGLPRGRRQGDQLHVGGGQEVMSTVADGFERGGGVGVAPALTPSVRVVVVRPAVEVGVLVGVRVPGVEDLLAVADVAVEVLQGLAVCERVEGDGLRSSRFSGVRPDG
ncbi:hypothetical protein RKD23_001122 [Streptomyces sp. SAI-170]|uniref:hypothetical protein n=1 Tax=Streptomyces sp. SAI-170 TaxID=3377729 RepID=UPI003C7C969A